MTKSNHLFFLFNLNIQPLGAAPILPEILPTPLSVAKFKRPRVLCDQKISEDKQELRPGCPPDYQIFFMKELTEKLSSPQIFQVISLINKNSSMRTSRPHTQLHIHIIIKVTK